MLAKFVLNPRHEYPRRRGVKSRSAFTTLEMSVVLFFLVITAALVLPMTFNVSITAGVDVTRSQLVELRNALSRYWTDVKFAPAVDGTVTVFEYGSTEDNFDFKNVLSLRGLFSNPDLNRDNVSAGDIAIFDSRTKIGWNGPYLSNTPSRYPEFASGSGFEIYGIKDDPTMFDMIHTNDRNPLPIVVQAVWNPTNNQIEARVVSAGLDGHITIDPSTTNSQLVTADATTLPFLVGDDLYETFTLRP